MYIYIYLSIAFCKHCLSLNVGDSIFTTVTYSLFPNYLPALGVPKLCIGEVTKRLMDDFMSNMETE